MKCKSSLTISAGLLFLLGLPVFAGSTYSVYSDPPLTNGGTLWYGLNDYGSYVGWTFSGGAYLGFSVDPKGMQSPVAPAGAIDTHPTGINDDGVITGYFRDSSGTHGFVDAGGVYRTLNFPLPGVKATYAYGINVFGQVAGYYVDAGGVTHGFVEKDGVFTTIDIPGAIATYGLSLDDVGDVVGSYFDGTTVHGFRYHNNNLIDVIDYPGADATWVTGMDNAGMVVGWSRRCPTCSADAFLKPAIGPFWLPHVTDGPDSYITDINDFGLTLGLQEKGLLPGNGSKDQYPQEDPVQAPEPGIASLLVAGGLALLIGRRFGKQA